MLKPPSPSPEQRVLLTFVLVTFALSVWLTLASRPTAVPQIGAKVPLFQALTLATLSPAPVLPIDDDVTLVTFWATWCRGCKEALHQAQTIQRRLGEHRVRVAAVSIDTRGRREQALAVADSIAPQFTWLLDAERKVYRAYGNNGLGQTFVVDRSGVLRDKFFGPTLTEARVAAVLD